MIEKLLLKNFRNFSDSEFYFQQKNFISGKNGMWKTNILEALSLFASPLLDIDFSMLLKKWEEVLYIEIVLIDGKKVSLSYDSITKKKKYSIQGKNTTKKKVLEIVPPMVSFHPLGMNLMYFWPSKRRDFLDHILSLTFPDYGKLIKKYKKIVTSRNKVLKNISEWKSKKSEIDFWNKHFLELACEIYKYRIPLIRFIQNHSQDLHKYFSWKIEQVQFQYISKIDIQFAKESIQEYLDKNLERDIILRKTYIWPHVDDFNIFLDNEPIAEFASRGEVKSTIIGLKFLEAEFIKQYTGIEPLFLVDDLLSELDDIHKDMIFENIGTAQNFITSIEELPYTWNKVSL